MKKFIVLLLILLCTVTYADNVNIYWKVGDNTYATTQCEMGNDLILPTTPTKTGYTFRGWRIAQYIPIEYLESTGTQYIDTGVVPHIGYSVDMTFQFVSIAPVEGYIDTQIVGVRQSQISDRFYPIAVYDNSLLRSSYGTSQIVYNKEETLTKHRIEYNKNNQVYLDGINRGFLSGYIEPSYQNSTMYLFKWNYGNTLNPAGEGFCKIRIYEYKMYNTNNILVRDMIPVLDPDGVPCMYDRVEGKFYYNAGTGQFIAGPIINE